jgi:hypothetical protein
MMKTMAYQKRNGTSPFCFLLAQTKLAFLSFIGFIKSTFVRTIFVMFNVDVCFVFLGYSCKDEAK